MLFALLAACGSPVTYGGGSLTITLDDTAHSGVVITWNVDGLTGDAVIPTDGDVESPFLVNDGAGEANGAYLLHQGSELFVLARAAAHHPEAGDHIAISGPSRPECTDQVRSMAFEYNDATGKFVYLRLFETDLPDPDPEGGSGAVASAVFTEDDGDITVVEDSQVEGSLRSEDPDWRWRDDGCWADWDPTIDVEWAFDEDVSR